MSHIYVVVREWNCDLDRKAPACWYTLFMSNEFKTAVKFANNYSCVDSNVVHVCKVPLEEDLDIVGWEKYICHTFRY